MALGQFIAPQTGAFIKGDTFDPRLNHSKPLIVVVREFKPDFVTKQYPKPKDVVIVDLVDLIANDVKVSVIWGAAAVVDRLKGMAGTDEKLPVKLEKRKSQTNSDYFTVVGLEGKELELAVAFDQKRGDAIEKERAERQAEADARFAEQTGGGISAQASPAAVTAAGVGDDDLARAMAALGD
jgi:hypothetical protein